MSRLVLKFGGTSLATPARVRLAARRVSGHLLRGRQVAVVVSAAGDGTDRIVRLLESVTAWAVSPAGSGPVRVAREADRALATGEALSATVLAAALEASGVPARSLSGAEAGIVAAGPFGSAAIRRVDTARIERLLAGGIVPVVAGFQGGREDGETVTLGRGSSDTSAVALAAALGAECHIVTDVPAVFDRDPRVDADARPLTSIEPDELVGLAERGAKVVAVEAARLARDAGVPLHVYGFRAPLSGQGGTVIRRSSDEVNRPSAKAGASVDREVAERWSHGSDAFDSVNGVGHVESAERIDAGAVFLGSAENAASAAFPAPTEASAARALAGVGGRP